MIAFGDCNNCKWGKRKRKIESCCGNPCLSATKGGEFFINPGRCRDRMCATCQAFRGLAIERRLKVEVGQWDSCRMLTLTLREDGKPLGERLDRLLTSFRKLRQRQSWKQHVSRGVAIVEVTPGEAGLGSHVHLHVLFDGCFWPQAEISKQWLEVTGDSPVVWINAIHGRAQGVGYVSSYVAKGNGIRRWPIERVREFAEGIHGRRLVFSFGKKLFKQEPCAMDEPKQLGVDGASPLKFVDPEANKFDRHCLSLHSIIRMADQGVHDAVELVKLGSRRNKAWNWFFTGKVELNEATLGWNVADQERFAVLVDRLETLGKPREV